MARWSSGLRLRPLTPATAVRIRYGSPKQLNNDIIGVRPVNIYWVGIHSDEGPPVPIPNTAVKLINAENTLPATAREDRTMPTSIFLLSSVGRACVHKNYWVLIPKISKIFRSPQLLLQYRRHADKISYREIAYFLGSGDLRRKTQIINQSIYSSIAQLVVRMYTKTTE